MDGESSDHFLCFFVAADSAICRDHARERGAQSVSADIVSEEEIRPKIALTFDDGPSAAYTGKLRKGLRKRGVHATFFLIGENIEKEENALLVQQMARDGHLIGNHTYHYVQLTKIGEEEAIKRIAGDE